MKHTMTKKDIKKINEFTHLISGIPTPTVQWMNNGKEIFDKAGKFVTKCDGMVRHSYECRLSF